MSDTISRRDFLKLAGLGVATSAVLTGCGPAAKYVTRQPYFKMPEYTYNGKSTYYATTCRECPAGCGIIVRTFQGRAIKIEGNPAHPVNRGKTCARGQAALQGLYNPDRIPGPIRQGRAPSLSRQAMTWEEAISTLANLLQNTPANQMAFLLGLAPDHLYDFVSELANHLGAPAPIRFGALSLFEGRSTLIRAAEQVFGQAALPFFDLGHADVVFSFGANFLETWLSPVAYSRGFSLLRKGREGRRGLLIQFEARLSQTASVADEWVPIRPGSESLVLGALGQLVARKKRLPAGPFQGIDLEEAARQADVPLETLHHLADHLAQAERPLVLVGGSALAHRNGLEIAKAALALNALLGNLGREGGVFLSPAAPDGEAHHRPASAQEMAEFIQRLASGQVKTLFLHGVNPLFELPASLGFAEALKKVETIVSFATFPDETALQADYIFPDHHALESFGYQRVVTGSEQVVLSGLQPVVSPFQNTQATVDVFLAALAQLGKPLPYTDEYAYLQSRLQPLLDRTDGPFTAPEILTFTALFQQHGGWWSRTSAAGRPVASSVSLTFSPSAPEEGEFYLHTFVSPVLGEAGANKPWLQEAPDPTTTVMWNTWLEINPETAHELGIENDDVVQVIGPAGAVEVPVYVYPAIRPDTIAIPFGQGHTAYGRYAAGRGANPIHLFLPAFNEAGDLAFGDVKVRLEKTGRKYALSRLESRIGVYGEGLNEAH